MPTLNLKFGDESINLTDAGDLLDLADPLQDSIVFKIADTAVAALKDIPLCDLSDTEIRVGFKVENESRWKLGSANVTFGLEAETEGALIIRKQGELMRYRFGQDDQDVEIVEVPQGHAYVSVELRVSLGVEGGGKFSHGNLGINAQASKNRKFVIANHKCIPLRTPVGDALQIAFAKFEFPFKPEGVEALDDNDYLEYEFIGKLALGFGLKFGVGGVFLAGRSKREIERSFESSSGKPVVKAQPSFETRAAFSVGYHHEDAFRVVVGRHNRPAIGVNTVTLFLFRMDQSELAVQFSAGISASAGTSVNLDSDLDKIIGAVATKLTEGLPSDADRDAASEAFKKIEGSRRQWERHFTEANAHANKLLKKLDNKKVEITVLHEQIKKDTVLFNYEFDLNRSTALAQGYGLAMKGEFAEAIKVSGVDLLPGSFVENEVIRRTAVSFQLFDLYRFRSITEYFRKSTMVYAGGGVFRLRFVTGVKHESGRVGHSRQVEVFFTADVLTKDFKLAANLDVKMHFVLNDHQNRKAARQTARALQMIAAGGDLAPVSSHLTTAIERDSTLDVKVSCVFDKSAFKNLKADDIFNGKPTPLPHNEDECNWNAFVRAVNYIHVNAGFKGEGFPDLVESFDNWILYNRTAIDREESTKPPNRTQSGNTAVDSRWPSRWTGINVTERHFLFVYVDAGRRFMNLCDDLMHLANDSCDDWTEERYCQLLKNLNKIIKEDVEAWFTKSTLAALFLRTGSRAVAVEGPAEDEVLAETFEISFRAVG